MSDKQEDGGEAKKTGEKERLLSIWVQRHVRYLFIAGGVVGINPTFNFANGQKLFVYYFIFFCINAFKISFLVYFEIYLFDRCLDKFYAHLS